MPMVKRSNSGPPTFGGGRTFVEQDLGTKDTSMMGPSMGGAPTPEFGTSRFGSNLITQDPSGAYNPKGPPSPGIPTHQTGARFGADAPLPDKTPAYNPTG